MFEALIAELEAGITFLNGDAGVTLARVEAQYPSLSQIALLAKYEDEVRAALPSVNIATALTIAQRSFLQIKSGRTGSNPNHAGGG